MAVNWKVRFKNKVWLMSFFAMLLSFIYTIIGKFGVIPSIPQQEVLDIINQFLMLLAMVGVIVDPTTNGIGDSERALGYDEPWVDPVEPNEFEDDE